MEAVSLPAVRQRSGQGLPRKRCPPAPAHTLALVPAPSIWALSAAATLRTLQAGAATSASVRAGPGSRRAGLPASPSVWGRKSRRALAGAAVPRAACPLLETVGTRFNWQNSTGRSVASLPKKDKLSRPFSSFWTDFCWSAFRCATET